MTTDTELAVLRAQVKDLSRECESTQQVANVCLWWLAVLTVIALMGSKWGPQLEPPPTTQETR